MSPFIFFALQFAIIAYALVGGVFLAFSDFIMRSLAHTGGIGGVDAMQVINREVFRWVFMTLFIGMAPVSLAIAAYGGFFVGNGPGTMFVLAGLIYFIGCFGVTVFCNVPMNEALARMEASSATAQDYWTGTYLPRWTFWNTVRTFASALAAAFLLFGMLWMTQTQAQPT
ncbi:MAG: anthrone oxygenase family protein [Pseudomonadota bacterium]